MKYLVKCYPNFRIDLESGETVKLGTAQYWDYFELDGQWFLRIKHENGQNIFFDSHKVKYFGYDPVKIKEV